MSMWMWMWRTVRTDLVHQLGMDRHSQWTDANVNRFLVEENVTTKKKLLVANKKGNVCF